MYEQYFRVLYGKLKTRTDAVGRKSMEDLPDDVDISKLQEIARVNISREDSSLLIFDTKDLILNLAGQTDCGIPKTKLKNILKATGNKDSLPEFQWKWGAAHGSDAAK